MALSSWVMVAHDAFAKDPPAPNVVVILADDLGYGDVHAYNPDSTIPTPNLDRLAEEGMRFTDAHSPSAVCTPTRYGLITGRYCWRSRLKRGVLFGYDRHLIDPERRTIADLFKTAGYRTGCVGKWHLGMDLPKTGPKPDQLDYSGQIANGPNEYGFDYYFGVTASLDMPPYVFIENDRFTAPATKRYPGKGFPDFARAGPIADGFTLDGALDVLTEKATNFISQSAKTDKPFFLYFPLTAPHKPASPAKRFQGRTKLGPYGDFVVQVDDTFGRIDAALREAGVAENTVVVFTSDNGSYMYRRPGEDHVSDPKMQSYDPSHHKSNADWRGTKADVWEGGHRVPFIVRAPGLTKPGSVSEETICHVDLFATFADLLGVEVPKSAAEDSFTFLPALRVEPQSESRPPVVNHSVSGMFALRMGGWKYVLGNGSGGRAAPKGKPFAKPYQLFDLRADPAETKNRIDDPETAEIRARFEDWTQKLGINN